MPALKIRSQEAVQMSEAEWYGLLPFGYTISYKDRMKPREYRFGRYSWLEIVDDPDMKDRSVDEWSNQLMLMAVEFTHQFGKKIDARIPTYAEMFPRIQFFGYDGTLEEYVYLMKKVYMYLHAMETFEEKGTVSRTIEWLEKAPNKAYAEEILKYVYEYRDAKHSGIDISPTAMQAYLRVFKQYSLTCDSMFMPNLKHSEVSLTNANYDIPYTAISTIFENYAKGVAIEEMETDWNKEICQFVSNTLTEYEKRVFENHDYYHRLVVANTPPPKPEPKPEPKFEIKSKETPAAKKVKGDKKPWWKRKDDTETPKEVKKEPKNILEESNSETLFGEYSSRIDDLKPNKNPRYKDSLDPTLHPSDYYPEYFGYPSRKNEKIEYKDAQRIALRPDECWYFGTDEGYYLTRYKDSIFDYLSTVGSFDKYMG
ncbi:MAG: hypothetical protein J6Y02_14760 [Pseudobutyrivibrio sp.]|nr:hypothetical protein [Pseudobutyrivibrio sp.]